MVGFKSNDVSRANFNAKVKALSERLGPVTKPERDGPRPPRQKWSERSKPQVEAAAEKPSSDESTA